MNKNTFWEIMERAKAADTEIMFENLMKEMTRLQEKDVQKFRAYLGAYTEIVNETIWIDMACKVINGYVSDDTGLYFSLWLISLGEAIVLKALQDPDSLSALPEIPFGDADFEMLMAVGFDEDEADSVEESIEALAEDITKEIIPSIQYKDGEKYGHYKSFEDGMADIPNILPKLIERAERDGFDWKHYIS